MPINLTLGTVSNDFLIAALLIYSLSVLAFAGDFAFGRPRRVRATAVTRPAKAVALATVGGATAGAGAASA
ncbi:MAG: c-type cytochrome biogenesis protein CcsB, partial [Streptosporangiaceae bacterium]